jgi:hypothetical protein
MSSTGRSGTTAATSRTSPRTRSRGARDLRRGDHRARGGGVVIVPVERAGGTRYQVCGRRKGRQVYVGTVDSEREVKTLERKHAPRRTTAVSPSRCRARPRS